LPTQPTRKSFAVNKTPSWNFHGMEEVIGSIPISSAKYLIQNQILRRAESKSVDAGLAPIRSERPSLFTRNSTTQPFLRHPLDDLPVDISCGRCAGMPQQTLHVLDRPFF
jgi:hypothetical protein